MKYPNLDSFLKDCSEEELIGLNSEDWRPFLEKSRETQYKHSLNGLKEKIFSFKRTKKPKGFQ